MPHMAYRPYLAIASIGKDIQADPCPAIGQGRKTGNRKKGVAVPGPRKRYHRYQLLFRSGHQKPDRRIYRDPRICREKQGGSLTAGFPIRAPTHFPLS